jgi:hypothetical protein
MELLTHARCEQLLANGRAQRQATNEGTAEPDFKPVVKLFTPVTNATWILTELDADNDTAFGLCDLGLGCPELGYVSLTELASVRGSTGPLAERDMYFNADKTLSAYTAETRNRHPSLDTAISVKLYT